jgi:hypothetical protein
MTALLTGVAAAGLVEQALFCVQPRSNDAAVQVWCHRAIDEEQAEPDETEHVDLMAGPSGEVLYARVTTPSTTSVSAATPPRSSSPSGPGPSATVPGPTAASTTSCGRRRPSPR